MPINASSNNPLYLSYRYAGPSAALIVPAALLNVVTISGVLMNSFVVLATLLTKSLHGTANFLLAMISLFEVLHQTGHTIFLGIQVRGTNFVSFLDAVKMELVMLFGLNASLCGMASAAFDRLFAVIDQLRHRRLPKPLYLGIHVFICACFGAASTLYVYQYYSQVDPDSPTTGCVAEVLSGWVGELFFKITAVMNAICAFFYLLVWIVIRCKKGVTKETSGRLLKSLVLILVVNIGGYFVNLGTYQVLFHLPPDSLDPITIWHIGFIAGILLNMGAASNALILYFNSTEYRKAFKRILNKGLVLIGSSQTGADRVFQVNSNQINPSGHSPSNYTSRTGPNRLIQTK